MSTHGEAILMSTHNIGFYEDLTKIIFQLSSNKHLISSSKTHVIKHVFLHALCKWCELLYINSDRVIFPIGSVGT